MFVAHYVTKPLVKVEQSGDQHCHARPSSPEEQSLIFIYFISLNLRNVDYTEGHKGMCCSWIGLIMKVVLSPQPNISLYTVNSVSRKKNPGGRVQLEQL